MKQLSHEADAKRYVLRMDDTIVAVADYNVNGNQISFHHTFTNPNFRNQGYAAEIVEFAIDDVEKNTTYRVVPMCWYVADWFESHAERRELLSRSA
jgi:uncharacterized protein